MCSGARIVRERAYLQDMSDETEVLYNGSCPICSREVKHYEKLTKQGALPIRYDDLSNGNALSEWGVSAEDAARRFHVRQGGQIYAGVPAFIILWREIPQTRWLARIVGLPGIHWCANRVYDHVLAPLLYAMHKRRMARR
jgi:predicted DCC family thiol-disulfide oxidoreductase YuxK